MIRRFLVRNESNLCRVKDAITGKEIFSSFPEEARLTVYDHDYWWSDAWDPVDYGRDYDFSRLFFEQLRELIGVVPAPSRNIYQLVNSDYSNNAGELKNCYLCFNIGKSEDSAYIIAASGVKNSFDVNEAMHIELCYESFEIEDCYRTFFSMFCDKCYDVWFSRNLTGCSNCLGCVNLRNKQYHIFNKPYTRERYFEEIKRFNLNSYKGLRKVRKEAEDFWRKLPWKFLHGVQNINVSGDFIHHSKNARYCYNVADCENVRYCQDLSNQGYGGVKDSYDFHNWGDDCELIYESRGSGYGCRSVKFSIDCWPANHDLEYCVRCGSSNNLFGCSGLKKKSYCILNKQYSKDGYFALREKIIKHMNEMPYIDKLGRMYRYGEFFPPEFSPFAYNETIAQDFFQLAEKEAKEKGYNWREATLRGFRTTIKSEDLPDRSYGADESILKEIIECSVCRQAYRIILPEIEFLKHHSIPLPRFCSTCRRKHRLSFRNPPRFYNQKCQCGGTSDDRKIYKNITSHFHGSSHCPNEFETSYAPERPEIVYCEACYQSEVI